MLRNQKHLIGTALFVAGAIAFSGCTATATPDPMASHDMGSMGQNVKVADDVMFAQMMIPHHMQAITMSAYAKDNAKNPQVLALAKLIYNEQGAEIATMKSWLNGATVPTNMMSNGMLSDAQMKELAAAKGADFDKLFLEGMTQHHKGAITMAEAFANSKVAALKDLARNIIKVQTVEISLMKLLAKQ